MKCKGINYDVGTRTLRGGMTRPVFDNNIVTREIEIIKSELHCNAIRISGCDIDRIMQAAEIALKTGFNSYNYLYNEDAQYDLDMAAYGIVKSLPENKPGYQGNLPWLPKTAFYKLANYYSGKKLI